MAGEVMTTTDGSAPLVPPTTLAQRIVATALEVCGIDASKKLGEFVDLLSPVMAGTSKAEIARILSLPFGKGGISTCGLVASGIHYRCKYDPDELSKAWSGVAVSRIVQYMRRDHRWVTEGMPSPGDCVLIGHNGDRSWGGVEHILTVVDVDGEIVESVDGGQEDGKHLQAIRTVRRRWVVRGGHPWLIGVVSATGRRVMGWGTFE